MFFERSIFFECGFLLNSKMECYNVNLNINSERFFNAEISKIFSPNVKLENYKSFGYELYNKYDLFDFPNEKIKKILFPVILQMSLYIFARRYKVEIIFHVNSSLTYFDSSLKEVIFMINSILQPLFIQGKISIDLLSDLVYFAFNLSYFNVPNKFSSLFFENILTRDVENRAYISNVFNSSKFLKLSKNVLNNFINKISDFDFSTIKYFLTRGQNNILNEMGFIDENYKQNITADINKYQNKNFKFKELQKIIDLNKLAVEIYEDIFMNLTRKEKEDSLYRIMCAKYKNNKDLASYIKTSEKVDKQVSLHNFNEIISYLKTIKKIDKDKLNKINITDCNTLKGFLDYTFDNFDNFINTNCSIINHYQSYFKFNKDHLYLIEEFIETLSKDNITNVIFDDLGNIIYDYWKRCI
jgi:hypothetical protein